MTTIEKNRIITPERYAQGLIWQQWMDTIKANKERFQRYYDNFQVKPEEVEFFKEFNARKGLKVVLIGADWCPDVVRGLPVVARLCEAAGLELRSFIKEENMDLMEQYLWRHKYESIPVVVFFNNDFEELGTWFERPASSTKSLAEMLQELRTKNLSEEEVLKMFRERREQVQMEWMHETVREFREHILYKVMWAPLGNKLLRSRLSTLRPSARRASNMPASL